MFLVAALWPLLVASHYGDHDFSPDVCAQSVYVASIFDDTIVRFYRDFLP